MNEQKVKPSYWGFAFSGFGCLLIALGINRFAYTPLVPALIHQGWLTESAASYLGAINFVGYFVGAYLGQWATRYFSIAKLIKINLIISVMSLAFSAIHLNVIWFAVWRFILGVTGGLLMVLTPSAILKNIPIAFRGKASGLVFSGIGVGIIISGFFLPFFAVAFSVSVAWLVGCMVAAAVMVISWSSFSKSIPHGAGVAKNLMPTPYAKSFLLLNIAYGLFAIGVIPHTLFLVDYVHKQLGLSEVNSGLFWVLYGIGAVLGPFITGFIADEIGIHKSLICAYAISCIGIIMVLYNHIIVLYLLSSLIMGMILPTIVGLTSARVLEIFGVDAHPQFWGKATLCFAIIQAIGTYFMSYILHLGYSYSTCFLLSAIALISSLIIISF